MNAIKDLHKKQESELTAIERCILFADDPGRYDLNFVDAPTAAAELEKLSKHNVAVSRALRQTARHMHTAIRARVQETHSSPDFDTCNNGWCKEAAEALNGKGQP